jgi:hypothetical protein
LMFGKKKEQALADEEAVKVELHRLESLPIEAVAAEVMTRTFGPSGPTVDGEIRANAIADGFLPGSIRKEIYRLKDHPVAGRGFPEYWQLKTLVRDGLQVLENKGLVVFEPSIKFPKYRATRAGVEAIERDAVQRVLREEPLA